MDKEQTLRLFEQGKDRWNEWAKERLAEREVLERKGDWDKGSNPSMWGKPTRDWHKDSVADFSEHAFEDQANFSEFIFPASARFQSAQFKGDARFDSAQFKGDAGFRSAHFKGDAQFDNAHFKGDARFDNAHFKGDARFNSAHFKGDAWFDNAHFKGDARFNSAHFKGDAWFNSAHFKDVAWFDNAHFKDVAWFNSAHFKGVAWFNSAHFKGDAWFNSAHFKGDAWFGSAHFKGVARFNSAHFKGDAWFNSAHFKGDARFDNAHFKGVARFRQVAFGKLTLFDDAVFERAADFYAIEANSAFSLARTTFLVVPDFIQGHFRKAPRLDELAVQPRRLAESLERAKSVFNADFRERFPADTVSKIDQAARWRTLKGLAIDAHDHPREQMFFRGEILSRRHYEDEPWHGAFWFGLFYQLFSDFGRSIIRPAALLIVCAIGFASLYLHLSPSHDERPTNILWWTAQWADTAAGHRERPPPVACIDGEGDQILTAIQLSFHKTLPIPGIGGTEKINQHYACLYGTHPHKDYEEGKLGRSFTPIIPPAVSWLGALQSTISLILLFLLFLAIRNHFRIR